MAHSEIVNALTAINSICPTLVKSFMSVGEQDIDDDSDGAHMVVGDAEHSLAQLSLTGFRLDGELQMLSNARLMKMFLQYPFL